MSATVRVNSLTLSHKGSGGMSVATIPDVCLTPAPPAPPIPIPYPNLAVNEDLVGGSTTVFADGGNMIATKSSHLSKSTGDEPGVAGGVMSGVNMMETSWLTYSMDVFIDGDNACRLTDKQAHNHFNAFNMQGQDEPPLPQGIADGQLKFLCMIFCICLESPEIGTGRRTNIGGGSQQHQDCVEGMLQANAQGKDIPGYSGQHYPDVTPEQGYNAPEGNNPPTPRGSGKGYRAPDSIIKINPDLPPTQDNIKLLVEMKFNRPDGYCDDYSKEQEEHDLEIVGPENKDKIVKLTPKTCDCPNPPEGGWHECEEAPDSEVQDQPLEQDANDWGAMAIIGAVVAAVGWVVGEAVGLWEGLAEVGQAVGEWAEGLGEGAGEGTGEGAGEGVGTPGETPPVTPGETPPVTPGETPPLEGPPPQYPPPTYPGTAGQPGFAPPPGW